MVAVLDNGRQDFYVGIYPPTGDYEFLDNQPAIDGVVLTKSTTKADLDLDKVFQYRGQVASYSKLPTKNRVIGDTYNVADTGENYAWNGSSWDLLTGFEAVYWRNGALESQGSTLTIDSDKNPISNLILEDITDVTATKDEVNELHEGTAVKNDFIKLHSVTADANELNILDGATLTTTELNYVDGVTSNIQTQLNGKEPTITGAATTITSSNLTKNRAVISNNSGKIAVSDTTSTELGYVHGVTSAIQTQLDNKISVNGGNITDSNWDNADYHSIDSNIVSENVNFAELTIGWKASPVDNEDLAVNLIKYNLADELGGSKYVFYDFLGNSNLVDKDDHSTKYCVDKIVHTTVYNNTPLQVNYALPSKIVDSTLATISDIPTTAGQVGAVEANTAITAGTGTKITYDSKGLVTGSASLSASDIPDISATYQTVISDLETIRTGAGLGATSVQNTATGTDSLSALGAQNSSFDNTIAVGKMAAAGGGGISIGYSAQNSSGGGVTIGYSASGSTLGVTIGMNSKGYGSNVVAIGNAASIGSIGSNVDGAIMLGSGINNNVHTFRVGLGVFENGAYTTYEMLDSEGKVPGERMSKQSSSAPTTSTVGNIGQFYVDTTNEDGYMCVGIDDTDPDNIIYTWKQITI